MPGSGQVTVNISNRTEGSLSPFGSPATVAGGVGSSVSAPSKNVAGGSAKGIAGSFRAKAEITTPIKGISVYDCPDENKVIILYVSFIPQGSTTQNFVKVGIYDKENTTVNEQLLQHATNNPAVKSEMTYKYTDENQNKFILTIKGTIKNDDDNADALFTVSQESR